MTPLTDEQVVSAIEAEEASAYGLLSSELQEQREQALDRYLGRPYGDEIDGRSQIISSDVADAVEWILPSLLKMFISGDDIVSFDAKSQEDEPQAQQETDYVNNVVIERNHAFLTFNSWFKDALLQKNGYVKAFWHTRTDVMTETYVGKSQEELDFLLNDEDVEVIGQRAYPDPAMPMMPDPQTGMPMPGPMLYDVKLKRKRAQEFVKFEPVPPEEVLVSTKARTVSLQDVPFVQHRRRLTISALRQMGYDIPEDISDNTSDETESNARNRFGEDSLNDESSDPAMREVWYRENWIRLDRDGDGVAELRRVCVIGTTLIHDEVTEIVNLAALTPIVMPHRHIGVSYFDLIQDLARIKTTLMRGLLDNLYLANNGRTAADRNTTNIEDLLVSRPGGIVRTDGPPSNSLMPLVTPDMSSAALAGLAYIDEIKENRTGVTKYSQGLDPDSLVKTATQASQLLTASQLRIEMIARCFAETGVKELFAIVHFLTLKHSNKEEKLKLRNKWVTVNPREWVHRFDLTINVGLGTGNRDQQLSHLMQILQMQREGMAFGLTDLSKIRTTLGKITQNAGFKNAELFWNEPDPQNPPPPPKPPEVQVAEVEASAMEKQSQTKYGSDMQIEAVRLQSQERIEAMRLEQQLQIKREENETRWRIAMLQQASKPQPVVQQ